MNTPQKNHMLEPSQVFGGIRLEWRIQAVFIGAACVHSGLGLRVCESLLSAHACNPPLRGLKQKDCHEFQTSLGT